MRETKTENWLNAGGYKWEYVEKVDFKKIDIEGSRSNPARLLKKVNEEIGWDYAYAMERGDEFPAIILLTLDGSKFQYLIATGVHRHFAYDANGKTSCDAYVVSEGDQYRRELLIRRANTYEGYGVTHDDRILQALEMHQSYPEITMTQLAKEWGLKLDTIKIAAT